MAPRETAQSLESLLRGSTFDFSATGRHKTSWEETFANDHAVLLDVRSNEEVNMLPIAPGLDLTVLHIPIHEVPDRIDEIPAGRRIAVFSWAGIRATMVYVYLHTLGLGKARILPGGLPELIRHALPNAIWKRQTSAGKES